MRQSLEKTKSTETSGSATTPLIPKGDVLKFLLEGKWGGIGYKEGDIKIVGVTELRTILLQAGYTEIALSRAFFGSHTDLTPSKRFPQRQDERFTFSIHTENSYGLNVNGRYDGVKAILYIVSNFGPDLPEGKDDLREEVLQQLAELVEVKRELKENGKDFISLSRWAHTLGGEIIFWLNPMQQNIHNSGWFTLDDLKKWAKDDKSSPVFKNGRGRRRQKSNNRGNNRFNFKKEYRDALRKHSGRGRRNRRLLKISLIGCPFPDLVKKYAKEIKFD